MSEGMFFKNRHSGVETTILPDTAQGPNAKPAPKLRQEQQQQQQATQQAQPEAQAPSQSDPTEEERLNFAVNQQFAHGRLDVVHSMLTNEGGGNNG